MSIEHFSFAHQQSLPSRNSSTQSVTPIQCHTFPSLAPPSILVVPSGVTLVAFIQIKHTAYRELSMAFPRPVTFSFLLMVMSCPLLEGFPEILTDASQWGFYVDFKQTSELKTSCARQHVVEYPGKAVSFPLLQNLPSARCCQPYRQIAGGQFKRLHSKNSTCTLL